MAPPMPPLPPGTDVWKTPTVPHAPPGYAQDLNHPATNKNIGVVTLSIFTSLAAICVCLRLYVRFKVINHKPWWDDLLIVIALPPQIALTGITLWMFNTGIASRHLWETPLGVIMFKLPYWSTVVAVLPQANTLLVKNALLLLYLRLFKPNRLVRYGIYFGIFIVTTMYTAWMFIFIFQTALQNIVGQRLSWAQAAFNLATDVYIFLLPISAVARLHMSTKRKIGVICVFSSGLAAIVMSSLTLYWRVQYKGAQLDATWTATKRMTLTALEIDVGIMCACMPLFATLLPKRARITSWGTYIRSMRSRLLRTNVTQDSKASTSDTHYRNVSDKNLVHKDGTYVELNERKSNASSARNDQRKEWFDGTTTIMNDTVIDRNSKDASQLFQQQQQQH